MVLMTVSQANVYILEGRGLFSFGILRGKNRPHFREVFDQR